MRYQQITKCAKLEDIDPATPRKRLRALELQVKRVSLVMEPRRQAKSSATKLKSQTLQGANSLGNHQAFHRDNMPIFSPLRTLTTTHAPFGGTTPRTT